MNKQITKGWLSIEREPTTQIIDLLEANTLGEPNKSMRYQHCRVRPKLQDIANPYFVSVQRRDKIIGTGCFCQRPTWQQQEEINSYYIRYFSFQEKHRIAQAQEQGKREKKSRIKEELKELLSPSGISQGQKSLFYSYLDPKNKRSANLCYYFGFEPVREFTTCLFSRLKPKTHPQVSKCQPEEHTQIESLLRQQYANYNMLTFENLFFEDSYYVFRNDRGRIVAGVQANFEHWRIVDMPGAAGSLILNVLPTLPVFNKLFNREYQFVALSGIYMETGHEQELAVLLESVLAIHQLTSALTWLDVDSDIYRLVSSLPKGLMNRFYHGLTAQIIAKTNGFSPEEIDQLKQQPAYISSFDLT